MTYKVKSKKKFYEKLEVVDVFKTRKRQKILAKEKKGNVYSTSIQSWGIHPTYMYWVYVYKSGKKIESKSKNFNTIREAKEYSEKIRRYRKKK